MDVRARNPLMACIVSTILVGCVAASTGGAGRLDDGRPVIVEAEGRPMEGYTMITISSPDGWVCDGTYRHAQIGAGSTVTFPVNCNDGRHGTAILAANQFQQQINLAFSIGKDRRGSATLGNL